MQLKGVDQRATDARSALNRLHWEVQLAIEEGKVPATLDLAEVLAIARQIGRLLDEHLPEGDPRRQKLELDLEFMTGLHEQPR